MGTTRNSRATRLRAIRQRLTSVAAHSEDRWLADVVPAVLELLGADAGGAYRFELGPAGPSLDFIETAGVQQQSFAMEFEKFAQGKKLDYAAFNPVAPQPSQRNTALTNVQIARSAGVDPRTTAMYREFLPRYGLERTDQLRVLVCEGRSLLAWVGGFRHGAFDDTARADLAALVAPLRDRLLLERSAMRARLGSAALPAAMEALDVAAFIVLGGGRVLEANSWGRAWLENDARGCTEAIAAAVRGVDVTGLRVAQIDLGTTRPVWFAWRPRPQLPTLATAAGLVSRWRLTARQSEVLRLLSRGFSNKAIAAELGCAEKTIELHLTAIYRKADVRSRSKLLARLLGDES